MKTSPDLRIKLRKIKTVTIKVKALFLKGCTSRDHYVQFMNDVPRYGLWEALLYCESWEKDGHVTPGTANAIRTVLS